MSAVTAPTPVRGSGTMRIPVFLIAIASCLVLSWLLASRENWLGMVLVLLAAVVYAVRLVTATRATRREEAEAAAGPVARSSKEQETLKAELREMRAAYERNRRFMLLISVVVGGVAVVAWSWNPAFALAMVLFAIPPLLLAWKNSRAVRKIDEGLATAR
jgi:Ca2+/Na+ antiporter